jgi:nucleoside-diphosphate-sugar epimerase
MSAMKILVTGSSGTIGTELVDQLRAGGNSVIGIDKVQPQKANCDWFYQYDLSTYPEKLELENIHDDIDLVIHLAANARVHNSVVNPELAMENMASTHYAFELARRLNVPKFIMASSRETYGETSIVDHQPGQLPIVWPTSEDNASQRNSLSPYTAGKIMGESYAYAYENCYNLDVRIVRFSNVYGRYDTSDRFIPKIIQKMLKDEPFEVWGEDKVLDFTYIEDAVEGILVMIDKWNDVPMEMNLAYGEGSRLVDVAEMVKEELGSESEISVTPSLVGEVTSYVADINKAKELGWKPKTDIREGIRKSIEYYKQIYS